MNNDTKTKLKIAAKAAVTVFFCFIAFVATVGTMAGHYDSGYKESPAKMINTFESRLYDGNLTGAYINMKCAYYYDEKLSQAWKVIYAHNDYNKCRIYLDSIEKEPEKQQEYMQVVKETITKMEKLAKEDNKYKLIIEQYVEEIKKDAGLK